jgi:hypothetical protein
VLSNGLSSAARAALLHRAVLLEAITVTWNAIEGILAVTAAAPERSGTLQTRANSRITNLAESIRASSTPLTPSAAPRATARATTWPVNARRSNNGAWQLGL